MNDAELDRLRELANIGAGHAASAFAQLAGRPICMKVPAVRALEGEAGEGGSSAPDEAWSTGVFFEFEGCVDALVGILFREHGRETLLRGLLGDGRGDAGDELVESALTEVGNILASHVASAIADTVGSTLLPSLPTLALADAGDEFTRLAAARARRDGIRIDCELFDGEGRVGGLLVMVPDHPAAGHEI